MLYGIDISNWQKGINLYKLTNETDFVIAKASEGLFYEDPTFRENMLHAFDCGLLRGAYHFARENNPEDEARYFYSVVKDYIGSVILVLDYETENWDNCQWCELFISAFYKLAHVYPLLYISASRLPEYENSWIHEKCGLWLAGYPYPATAYDEQQEMPYSPYPWAFAAIWQFTSSLQLSGYDSRLDGNYAYMDGWAWLKYACPENGTPETPEKPKKSTVEICKEIMKGLWGNDEERKNALATAGYNPDEVQDMLNEYYALANDIWLGKWGNGWNRKNAIEGAGYDYELAQMVVDALKCNWFDGC